MDRGHATDRLNGATALVFGGGTRGEGMGNGRACAIEYARRGAFVVVIDYDRDAADETVAMILGEGGEASAEKADVCCSEGLKRLIKRVMDARDRIDILHNNVGIVELGGPVEQDEAAWTRVIDTNLKSVFLTCKYVLPVMESQRHGVITNISSLASIRYAGTPWISYSASKGGVNQLTQAIALQYARAGIRANAILPGLMHTPMTIEPHRGDFENLDEMVQVRHMRCPPGFMGDAWDVAYLAAFLASPRARYINGAMIPVDGGISGAVP